MLLRTPSPLVTRLVPGGLLALAAMWIAVAVDPIHAQSIAVSKDLCGPTGACVSQGASPSVPPYSLISYPVKIFNNGSAALNVDVQETFPAGFHYVATGSTCGAATPGGGGTTMFGPVSLPPSQATTCVIYGYFDYLADSANNANNAVVVFASTDTTHQTPIGSASINGTVNGTAPIPTDLGVLKTSSITSTDPVTGAVSVHYTIRISNNGPNTAYGFQLQDVLSVPSTSVPLNATYVAGSATCQLGPGSGASTCFAPTPSVINSPVTVSTTSNFAQWGYPAGTTGQLTVGGSMVIGFDVVIAPLPALGCVRSLTGNALANSAHISFNTPGATITVSDSNPVNNTATTAPIPVTINAPVDAACGQPALGVSKTLDMVEPPTGFPWGSVIPYTITLTNHSTLQTINGVQLLDALNHTLGDLVQAGVGTPPFTATIMSVNCASSVCQGYQTPNANVQQLAGYGDTKWMFGTTMAAAIAPGASVSFQLGIKYSDPGCDSYSSVALKPIINVARASYHDVVLGDQVVQTGPVVAHMSGVPPCAFTVQKSASNGVSQITFGAPVTYAVTFANPTTGAVTMGTLVDAMRIVQPAYATQLPVSYTYTCAPGPNGGVTGYPGATATTGSLTVVNTSLPQQGVRIIQNTTPVVFQPQSTLTCSVTVTVSRPAAGDPNCARVGQLENTVIADPSAFYNANLPWPAGSVPGNAASVTLPLPQCMNLVVNKAVDPIWTPPAVPPPNGNLNYTLKVTNMGAPIVAADGVTLTDTFTPAHVASTLTTVCSPLSNACAPTWSPSPLTASPSTLNVNALGTGQSIVTTFPVAGPFPAPPGQVCNAASAAVSLPTGAWYKKDPSTWQTNVCAPIFNVSTLDVTKLVAIAAPATTPPLATFTVDVICSFIQGGVQYGPSTTVSFASSTPGTRNVPNIPVGSTCVIVERPLPPPIAMSVCPSGSAAWMPAAYPNPPGPNAAGTSISIAAGPNALRVRNTFACVPPASLRVTKTFAASSPASQFPPPAAFPVQVVCTGRSTSVNLTSSNFQQTVPNLAIGANCTITELPPVGLTVSQTCHWITTYPSGQTATMQSGVNNLEVHNELACTGIMHLYKTFDPASLGASMPPTAVFPIQLACQGLPTTTVNLSAGNQFHAVTASMPSGTLCTIAELPPLNAPIPANCHWAPTTYSKGQNIPIAVGVVSGFAQNSLACTPPTSSSLSIRKTMSNLSPIQSPNPPFPVIVNCTPGGLATPSPLVLTANAGGLVATNIPNGSNCTITETVPPMTPPGMSFCQWVPSIRWDGVSHPNGSQILNVQGVPDLRSIEVHNDFVCNPTPVGSLTIKKTIEYDTMDWTTHDLGDFKVLVSCVTPVWNQTVTLTHANNYQGVVAGLLPGAQCNVTEVLPQSPNPNLIPVGTQWIATYPAGQTVPAIHVGPQTFLLKNVWVGNTTPPGQAELVIKKFFTAHWLRDPNHTMTFQIPVSCVGPGGTAVAGFPQTVTLTPSVTTFQDAAWITYAADAHLNVPVGSTCTASEPTRPPMSADLSSCTWTSAPGFRNSSYPTYGPGVQGASVTLSASQRTYNLMVDNDLACPRMLVVSPPGSGTYDLGVKLTSAAVWAAGATGVFNVEVTNNGAVPASSAKISVTDRLPPEFKLVNAIGAGWICSSSTPLTCTFGGVPTAGKSLPPIAITAIMSAPGKVENCARVSLQGAVDAVATNDSSCVTVVASAAPVATPGSPSAPPAVTPPPVSPPPATTPPTKPTPPPTPPPANVPPVKAMTSLSVFATVNNLATVPFPNPLPVFAVTVTCGPGGPANVALKLEAALNGNGRPQSVANIAADSTCRITETIPVVSASAAASCRWVPTVKADGQPVAGGQTAKLQAQAAPHSIEVHNDFVCGRVPQPTTMKMKK